jgi:hypothetical protein
MRRPSFGPGIAVKALSPPMPGITIKHLLEKASHAFDLEIIIAKRCEFQG